MRLVSTEGAGALFTLALPLLATPPDSLEEGVEGAADEDRTHQDPTHEDPTHQDPTHEDPTHQDRQVAGVA